MTLKNSKPTNKFANFEQAVKQNAAKPLGVPGKYLINNSVQEPTVDELMNFKPSTDGAIFNLSTTATGKKNGEERLLAFEGYNGGPVKLRDYGMQYDMYYNIAGITYLSKVPILYEHWTPLGHTTTVTKTTTQLSGEGVPSFPSEARSKVIEALDNGFPFQASMGLRVENDEDIEFLAKGQTRLVNGRNVVGPCYICNRSFMEEMTITMSGRDNSTSFTLLNGAAAIMLKNSATRINNSTPPGEGGTPPVGSPAPLQNANPPVSPSGLPLGSTPAPLQNSTPPVVPPIQQPTPPVAPNPGQQQLSIPRGNALLEQFKLSKLMSIYSENMDIIENGLAQGKTTDEIEQAIKLHRWENGLAKVPAMKDSSTASSATQNIEINFALSFGVTPETLEKKGYDRKLIDNANSQVRWSFIESMVNIANNNEGQKRFTGFSDVEYMMDEIKNSNRRSLIGIKNTSVSAIDMPNMFKRVSEFKLEERWALQPPFATRFLKEESNQNFKPTQRIRPGGGEIWEQLKANGGKLPMTQFGTEKAYTTVLDTVGQLAIFPREVVINDELDVISELLMAMVEGAMVVPDIKLGFKMLVQASAASTFWVNADNSRTSFALTRANLSTAYNDLRTYNEDRGKNLVQLIEDRWILLTSIELEETAWDIIKQDRIVNDTTANTKTGDKNYWFNKMDLEKFNQMANTSLFGAGPFVSSGTWMLWPKAKQFSPYSITYLRGQKRPTVETVELPENMLGFGVRGYWDVEINERERLAIGRYRA